MIKAQIDRFVAWLMTLTTMMRYLVIAILFHAGIIAVLATIKIAAEIPKVLAIFNPDTSTPPPPSEEPLDPTAALREFEYNGPTLGGGGGTPGKGPGGIPTAAGNTPTEYKATILSETRGEEPIVGEVVGVVVDAAQAFRPQGTPGGMAAPTTGLGDGLTGTAGVKGPGGGGFGQRQGPIRSQIIGKTRRGQEIERATLAGLRWLQAHQNENGSWTGPTSQAAVSALAVLAFLGHGETPESREFGNTVTKGLQFLVSSVNDDGVVRDGNMYAQGAVTLALSEAYGMTQSSAVKGTLDKAVTAIHQSQKVSKDGNNKGGWRYRINATDSDTSVSGWMIMALKSARLAGIEVPQDTFDAASDYLWHTYGSSKFGYQNPGRGSDATTAIGVLCQQFLGHGSDERIKKALDGLKEKKPDWQTFQAGWVMYTWYYINQAMFQAGGSYATEWNSAMSDTMIKTQAQDGHWEAPPLSKSEVGYGPNGNVYTTAMGCLILEVYYRYLPLYQQHNK